MGRINLGMLFQEGIEALHVIDALEDHGIRTNPKCYVDANSAIQEFTTIPSDLIIMNPHCGMNQSETATDQDLDENWDRFGSADVWNFTLQCGEYILGRVRAENSANRGTPIIATYTVPSGTLFYRKDARSLPGENNGFVQIGPSLVAAGANAYEDLMYCEKIAETAKRLIG